MDSLTFQPILGPVVLTILALATLAMLLVGPSFAKIDRRKRWTLSLLRLGVIGLAFLTMLRPGCVQKIEKNQAAVLIVLVDISRSMTLPHISDDSSRWQTTVDSILANQSRFQQLIEDKIDVKFIQFDSRSEPIEIVDGVIQLPKSPDGSETDVGSSIYEASLSTRDRPLMGVILYSDCVQNVLEPEIELTEAVGSLVDMEVPLYGVQLGAAGETGQFADLAITSFAEQQVVNKKSDLTAKTTLVARGYANQDVQVDLILSDGATEKVVATEFVRPEQSYEEINVQLKYRPTEPGEFRITVRANPMPGEVAIRNNSLDGFLTVRDEGMRALFLSGGLGFEQRRLRDAFRALDFVDMDFQPIYTDRNSRRNWPLTSLTTEFSDPKLYDVFILCNVDSRALYDHSTKQGPLTALANAVNQGKGLLMIGGTHSFDAGMYQQTPLRDILPIRMQSGSWQEFDVDVRPEFHVTQPIQLEPTVENFLTRITDSGSNREAWKALPPLPGANRLVPKQTAEVILQSGDDARRPMLVAATVGGGRVLAFAGDTTWRWKMAGFDKEFDQFWRQLVLWLAFWDSKNDESLSIDLPKRRYAPKSRMKFGVNVRTITGETIEDATFDSFLVLPNGSEEAISINRSGDRYECQVDPELLASAGVYRVKVAARHDGNAIGTAQREFVVIDQDKEKSNPAANPEQMARLANQTSDFGGRAISPEQVAEVLDDMIANPPMKKIEIPTKWRMGETVYDATAFLVAFVGLLAVEWFLRKKWGLV